MTKREEDIIWKFLFNLAAINGELSCTVSDDQELRKWFSIDAKTTRDRLIEAQDKFMKEIGFK